MQNYQTTPFPKASPHSRASFSFCSRNFPNYPSLIFLRPYMEPSILSSVGADLLPILSPVSICMLLVVALISAVHPPSEGAASAPIRTAATLVYLESPSDSPAPKLQGALLNATAFIALITFLLVLLYYYNFISFLKHYMRFSTFFVFAFMGGAIFLSVIQWFSLPIDAITCFLLLFNFTAAGVLSVFSNGFPIIFRQRWRRIVHFFLHFLAWRTCDFQCGFNDSNRFHGAEIEGF